MEGKIHISTDEAQTGAFRANADYFIKGLKETYVQNFYFDMALQQPAMTIATPIKDNRAKTIAVLAGRVNLDKIADIMIERSGLGETGETYLVNKFNLLVSKSRFIEGIEFKKVIRTEAVVDGLKGHSGYLHYTDYRNVPVIGVYRWIPQLELLLLVKMDEKEALQPISNLKFIILLVVLGSALLAVVIGIFLTRSISKPIIRTAFMMREIAHKKDFTRMLNIASQDEIGELALSFNEMTQNLRRTTTSVENLNREINERKRIEGALRKAEENYRMQFEGALDAILVADPQTGIIVTAILRQQDCLRWKNQS